MQNNYFEEAEEMRFIFMLGLIAVLIFVLFFGLHYYYFVVIPQQTTTHDHGLPLTMDHIG